MTPDVRAFLAAFEAAGATADPAAVGPLFAETFLSLDPGRAVAVPRAALLAALPAREAMFGSQGLGPAALVSAEQVDLDETYVLVETTWTMPPTAPAGEPLTLRSAFLLRRDGEALSVVVYLNHQDIAAVLAARGVSR